jgi:heme/copper-type cytochrome/quinol oxidase subunit 3
VYEITQKAFGFYEEVKRSGKRNQEIIVPPKIDGSTIGLDIYFTLPQGLEYYEARFYFAGRFYGRTFFIAMGFHVLHVFIGTLFLSVKKKII